MRRNSNAKWFSERTRNKPVEKGPAAKGARPAKAKKKLRHRSASEDFLGGPVTGWSA